MRMQDFNRELFNRQLKEKTRYAEEVLMRHCPKEEGLQKLVIEAMNYSLTAGGKRLRPVLMWETYMMCGGEKSPVIEAFMAAMEMIHTYSLVHDDLPAMDNDEYRRGRKTTWSVYGDAFGILAGDGLLNYAFETAIGALQMCEDVAQTGQADAVTARASVTGAQQTIIVHQVAKALGVLAKKAGIYGMIGGQTVDIESENQPDTITEEQLLFIHEHKTAALIQASMMIGAILAGASEAEVSEIEKCAYNIGIAFQIQDDILDVIGDSEELGKPVGSDAENNKQTYVTLKGLEQAKADVEALSGEAVAILDSFDREHDFLTQLIYELIHRRK